MDRGMDGWKAKGMNLRNGQMKSMEGISINDGWMGKNNKWKDKLLDGWSYGWAAKRTNAWKDTWMNGGMSIKIDRQTHRERFLTLSMVFTYSEKIAQ